MAFNNATTLISSEGWERTPSLWLMAPISLVVEVQFVEVLLGIEKASFSKLSLGRYENCFFDDASY